MWTSVVKVNISTLRDKGLGWSSKFLDKGMCVLYKLRDKGLCSTSNCEIKDCVCALQIAR